MDIPVEDRRYIGVGHAPNQPGPGKVYVTNGKRIVPLRHHVKHSPDGFNWGYGGSGPAELARCLLWDALDKEPAPSLYQDFKAEFVANWPMHTGNCWEVTRATIIEWVAARAFIVGEIGDERRAQNYDLLGRADLGREVDN